MLVTEPAAVSLSIRATTVTVLLAFAANVPHWQTAPPHTPESDAVAETSVKPSGSWSFTSTFRAKLGPLLVMMRVYVTNSPALAEAVPVLEMTRSERCPSLSGTDQRVVPTLVAEVRLHLPKVQSKG